MKTRIACDEPFSVGFAAFAAGPRFHAFHVVIEVTRGEKRVVILDRRLSYPRDTAHWVDLTTAPSPLCGEVDVAISGEWIKGDPLPGYRTQGARRASACFVSHLAAPRQPEKMVLVLLQDALRADRLGAWGCERPTSPYVDRLSRESTLFTRAIAASSWTRSSVASVFTSLLPWDHGALDRDDPLDGSVPTLAELLKGAGVQTAATISNGNIGFPSVKFNRGFETWDLVQDAAAENKSRGDNVVRAFASTLPRIARRRAFAYVHLVDPHAPYAPLPPFAGLWDDPGAPFDGSEDPVCGFRASTSARSAHTRSLYDEEVMYGDSCIGKLRAHLRKARVDPSIVFIADHGEEFGDADDHWAFEHGTTVYEQVLHVPLLVKERTFPASGLVTRPVSLLDVAPTVLAFFGLDAPPSFTGVTLAGTAPSPLVAVVKLDGRELAAREADGRKQVFGLAGSGLGGEFDIEEDPGERFPRRVLAGSFESWLWAASRRRPGVVVWASETKAGDVVSVEVPAGRGSLERGACFSARLDRVDGRLDIKPFAAGAFALLGGEPKALRITLRRGDATLISAELEGEAMENWESRTPGPKLRVRVAVRRSGEKAIFSSEEQKHLKGLGYLQ
ncbi:MAG: sulfatase [Acidobacteriota bacterium]